MKNLFVTAMLVASCNLVSIRVQSQVTDTTHYNYGIWQAFGNPFGQSEHPEVRGRLSNYSWKDIEVAPDQWEWTSFDSSLADRAADGLPIIFMVYTEEDAPDWLYSNGVPKVPMYNSSGALLGYAPYYADDDYKFYFKRMIAKVREHIETLPSYIRDQLIAVQGCYGSTGDYISYKGTVPGQYALTSQQFYSLFQEFSLYYYDQYKNTNPKIYLLSNPQNNGQEQCYWLIQNCPGGWIKTGTLGKGYQLNDEISKADWLYSIINYPQMGNYVRARSEIIGASLSSGWWNESPYENMFALLCYCIYWGVDWSNQGYTQITDNLYDTAFGFYNKYAGYKDPAKSNVAMCMLKDAIDAADSVRFPSSQYGVVQKTATRFNSVLAPFVSYGAKLEDVTNAVQTEQENLVAAGTNDVGWNIFAGNYDRYLHQLSANQTSSGYWNVASSSPNTIYGKYARGFDVAKGKNRLIFDVDNAFLNNQPLNGAYPVMIEITYLDKGTGSWQLLYDAVSSKNKSALTVKCTNSNLWKKASVTINDAYFGNRAPGASDFFIKNTGTENVLFSVVELTRSGSANNGSSLFYSGPVHFDTTCYTSVAAPKQITVSGQFLNGSTVKVGPLNGFGFSFTQDAAFTDSLTIASYGAAFSQSVYVQFKPSHSGAYNGSIPVKGGGATSLSIATDAYAINSNPNVDANVQPITCYNAKDGAINLQVSGGQGPFSFSWKNNTNNFKSTSQNISALIPSDYIVNINASYGCSASYTYSVTQPDVLSVAVSSDSMLCSGGTTNVYVTATGGTTPYSGTGTFNVKSGFNTYTVTDKNGCTDKQGYSVKNGTLKAPAKPGIISGGDADATGVCGAGNFTFSVNDVATATGYTWSAPQNSQFTADVNNAAIAYLQTTSAFKGGTISVAASNACGTSVAQTKSLSAIPAKPGGIQGPDNVLISQAGIQYSVPSYTGLKYVWTVPGSVQIVSGQNTPSIVVNWGKYSGYIKVQAVNDCGSSTYSNMYVTASSSLVQNTGHGVQTQQETALAASPNPANAYTSLRFNSATTYNYTAEITDANGKIYLRKNGVVVSGSNQVILNLQQLPAGFYIVNVINNNTSQTMSAKLVKQ